MSKRPYGTGHLYEKDGSWYGRWRSAVGTQRNRRIGIARTPGARDGLTKPQAERELRRRIEQDAATPAPAAERVDIVHAAAAHYRRLEARDSKPSYLASVESIMRVHLLDAREFRRRELGELTEEDIERYITRKLRAGLAPATVRHHLGVLHSIFQLGLRRRWCQHNPVKLVDGPKIRRNALRIRFLTQEELEALLRASYPDDALGSIEPVLYLTAAMTGLRQNELFALRWRYVDWVNERLRVVQGYVRGQFTEPKTQRSARSVPMALRVAQELERHHRRTIYDTDDDLVFAHPALGGPLDPSKILKRLRAAEQRAGVRGVTFHELRHTFGTRCAAAGVPMRTIQAWMGHEDPDTTAIYAHYQPAAEEAAMIERAFTGPRSDALVDALASS
jgi:integrase